MSTVGDIENWIASYLGRTSVADLNPSNFTPAGIDMDLGLIAINSARRIAERAHDFKYSETNVLLSISTNGGSITAAYQDTNVAITGTLSPNVTGSWTLTGQFNGFPFHTIVAGGVQYFLYNTGGGQWIIAFNLDAGNAGGNYWALTSTSATPQGTYTAVGTYTGAPVVANTTGLVGVKRIKYVSLPLGSGEYEPIEFMTSDQFTARQRMQIGRQNFNPTMTLGALGVSTLGNPLAYQNGQSIYLAGANIPLPIISQLSIVQWLPEYTDPSDTDFITQYGPEFLQWQSILEINKVFKRYAPKQEGNIDEEAVQSEASAALQTLIEWDNGTVRGSSTPGVQLGQQTQAPQGVKSASPAAQP